MINIWLYYEFNIYVLLRIYNVSNLKIMSMLAENLIT